MFRDEIDRGRRLGSVEEAAAAADKLDLADALRHRLIIERREPDPLGHQRQTVLEEKGVFGFLGIPEAAIAVIELAGILLLGNDEAGGLGEQLLVIVALVRRLFVERDHRRLFRDGDLRLGDFAHDVLELGPGVVVRMRRGHRLAGDVDGLGGDGLLGVKRWWEVRKPRSPRRTSDADAKRICGEVFLCMVICWLRI